MRVAFVGCGYVADQYARTMAQHPSVALAGVYDRDPVRQKAFCDHHGVTGYPTYDALLADPTVAVVVNLTNPAEHADVTRAALRAGRHVYAEKPMALDLAEARSLADLARTNGLGLASAPCSVLGETAQTVWDLLGEGRIGTVRLVYAEMDAGPVLRSRFRTWVSPSGAPWPYDDEFRTGCVIEHGGYSLTWLTAFFGPVTRLIATAASLVPNGFVPNGSAAPDFSVACLTFAGGVIARLTIGQVAPQDQSLRIVGDKGVIDVRDGGDFESPVTVTRRPGGPAIPVALRRAAVSGAGYAAHRHYDFARGVADLAAAVTGERESRLPVDHALHVLELTLAIARAGDGVTMTPSTTFAPMSQM